MQLGNKRTVEKVAWESGMSRMVQGEAVLKK